jgi:hypothetical protein
VIDIRREFQSERYDGKLIHGEITIVIAPIKKKSEKSPDTLTLETKSLISVLRNSL